jgi:hypothetical protein
VERQTAIAAKIIGLFIFIIWCAILLLFSPVGGEESRMFSPSAIKAIKFAAELEREQHSGIFSTV